MMRTKTKNNATGRKGIRAGWLGHGLALGLTFAVLPAVTGGYLLFPQQAAAEPAQRIVDGSVQDKDGKPLSGAVVYLKDQKTLAVKSYLTDDEGHFRFGELSQAADYEIWAQFNGVHSKSKNISSFDNRNDFHFQLKIDK